MNITEVEELDEMVPMSMDWKGHTVNFKARKSTMTPQFLKDAGDIMSYPKAVAEAVGEWDVTMDEKGTIWPLTEPELSRLPVPFLTAMLNKVSEPWAGDKKKPQDSASGLAASAK